MFKAASGARIIISSISKRSSRVWLEVPLGEEDLSDPLSQYNVLEVSVEAADLERAYTRWQETRSKVATGA